MGKLRLSGAPGLQSIPSDVHIPGGEYEHPMVYLNNILCSNVILLLVLGYMAGLAGNSRHISQEQ